VPGDQKLAPLSSAGDERWPKKVEKAIAETKTNSLGERLCATGRQPPTVHGMIIVGPNLRINKTTNHAGRM
jgi:hypothetical protein